MSENQSSTHQKLYDNLLGEARQITDDIVKQISTSIGFDDYVTIDVPIMLDNYVTQTELLLWRYNKLSQIIVSFSVDGIQNSIDELATMTQQTDDAIIKNRCETSLKQYELHKETIEQYVIQKDKIKKRLDSTIFILLKIQYDLRNLMCVNSNRHKLEFYKNFQDSFGYDL